MVWRGMRKEKKKDEQDIKRMQESGYEKDQMGQSYLASSASTRYSFPWSCPAMKNFSSRRKRKTKKETRCLALGSISSEISKGSNNSFSWSNTKGPTITTVSGMKTNPLVSNTFPLRIPNAHYYVIMTY